ncbi:hypothetical protein K501DRAFT_148067, partial [Backusella circina FSU 941]
IQQYLFNQKQKQRNHSLTIRRARAEVHWDPILLLPSTNKERSGLLRWRLARIPPGPSVPCHCKAPKANLQHFDTCIFTSFDLLQLHHIYHPLHTKKHPHTDDSIATCKELIDSVLNNLPTKFDEQTDPIWIEIWPLLLEILRNID